ncbi:hypothetical protein [Natronoarchaeum rubrum]|uniref:hypothetical protein n=1 Tax=Natronoarchaeum rubrum TaxID=755311 RepID=UPI002111C25D|nr:hypothetical protein [Natronoarchaeum rubrum]
MLDHETSYPLRALKSEPNPVRGHDRSVSTVLDSDGPDVDGIQAVSPFAEYALAAGESDP